MVIREAYDRLKNSLVNETDNLGLPEALFIVAGAVFLYIIDLTTKWNGYRYEDFFTVGAVLAGLRIVFFGVFVIRLIMVIAQGRARGAHWSEYITESILYFIWILAGSVGLSDTTSTLHLVFSIGVYFIYGKAVTEEHKADFASAVAFLTAMDFFGYAFLNYVLPLEVNQFNRIMVPLWLFYTIGFAMKHNSSGIFGWLFFGISLLYIVMMFDGVSLITQQTDNLDQGVVNQAKESLQNGLSLIFVEIPKSIRESWHNFYQQTFNQSYIYGGQQEETQNPQGVYFTEIERGDYTFYEGSPVYLWARFEARTLDEPITVTVECNTELADGTVVEGVVNEESTEYEFIVISGVDRTISCRFDEDVLVEGRYEAIFNATFDFGTDGRRKIYLMNRDRYIEELQALNQRGIEPTGRDILRQLDITDTNPESIYTSGPVLLGIGTNNVPWDIGEDHNIKYRFGVTVENEWTNGGELLRINNVEMIVPDTFDLLTSGCDVPMQGVGTRDGDKVYATKGVIDDIDDFRTINCQMNVDLDSLDPIPVTTRFLRAHVDYTYMMTEETDFEIERIPGAGPEAPEAGT